MNDSCFIFTHGEDPDGIFSSVLLGKYLQQGFERIFVRYGQLVKFFQQLSQNEKKIKGKNLYFADINCNDDILPYLKRVAELANSVIWIDHHGNTHRNLLALKEMGITGITNLSPDNNTAEPICSALLIVQQLLVPAESCCENIFWLGNFAEASDYPESCQGKGDYFLGILATAEKLQTIINFYNWKQDDGALQLLADKLARGKEWYCDGELDDELRDILLKCAKESEQAQIKLRQTVEPLTINGRKFFICFGNSLIYSKDTVHSLRDELSEDAAGIIAVFASPANNALFFRRAADFDAVPFCRYMGGGGREGNGGFSFSRDVTANNFLKIKNGIIKKLEEFFSV